MRPVTRSSPIALPEAGPSGARIEGDLAVPEPASGVVLFAHGTGSSRHSPRNKLVAGRLQESGLATLLLDLLTPGEDAVEHRGGRLRFDIGLLIERLDAGLAWLRRDERTRALPVGSFGASTGAAAALGLAGRHPDVVGAVVSRGGRPDLTPEDLLAAVRAPTLLIVGGADEVVLDMNRRAMARMRAPAELEVVPGASHLFEEPGALERVADLAGAWFARHLARGGDTQVGVRSSDS
jgi:putative phosphoribosyl transferase